MVIKPTEIAGSSFPTISLTPSISSASSVSPITNIALDKMPSSSPPSPTISPSLSSITLTSTTTSAQFAEIIVAHPHLTTLNLEGCRLTDEDLRQLEKLPQLTHLSIRGCAGIKGSGLKHLNPLSVRHLTFEHANSDLAEIAHLSLLRGLTIIDCRISDETLKHLTPEKFPFLEQLTFSECPEISDQGISESIAKLSSLKELNLKEIDISDKSLEKLSTLTALERLSVHGCTKITDKGIEYIATMESLNELDCTRCTDLTVKGIEQLKSSIKLHLDGTFLEKAIATKNITLLSLLLKNRILPEEELNRFFFQAVAQENKECVKVFLKCGFDPEINIAFDEFTITPFHRALQSGNMELIALLLCYRKDPSKPIPTLTELASIVSKYQKLKPIEYEKIIAQGFGPLVTDRLRIYSSYARLDVRQKVLPFFTNRLFQTSLDSIQHMINPLIGFVAKATLSNPEFAVYIVPGRPKKESDKETVGEYSRATGDISLFVSSRSDQTVLLHEIAHKAVDTLDWHSKDRESQMANFATAVEQDITTLQERHCDPIIIRHLSSVATSYPQQQRFEEYIVRTTEILSDLAHAHPEYTREQLEAILMRDIPHLYKIFKEHFLTELDAYDRR